ncbi:uncharacterized protein UDID_18970 [Ustilago sp. UG-2017a]|nr:uncharacterized protein UDID_18970 [Ustilago sp. UG-2017a]
MTRASTSAANFGLLLVALVLMLHSVVGELTPKHVRHHFFARRETFQGLHYGFTFDDQAYKSYCGEGSDPKQPCFTHWAGDLGDAESSFPEGQNYKGIITNNVMKDFTIEGPRQSFTIIYPKLGGVSLTYANFDQKTGCKDITLKRGDNDVWRIWVSDENGNDRDIDTKNHAETTKRFCSKWIHIHVKRDGRN